MDKSNKCFFFNCLFDYWEKSEWQKFRAQTRPKWLHFRLRRFLLRRCVRHRELDVVGSDRTEREFVFYALSFIRCFDIGLSVSFRIKINSLCIETRIWYIDFEFNKNWCIQLNQISSSRNFSRSNYPTFDLSPGAMNQILNIIILHYEKNSRPIGKVQIWLNRVCQKPSSTN